jgi:hypothetical protein
MSEMYGSDSIDDEDQLQSEDTLVDRGVDDILDEGYSPPDHLPASHRYGFTATEEHDGETLDQRHCCIEPSRDTGAARCSPEFRQRRPQIEPTGVRW